MIEFAAVTYGLLMSFVFSGLYQNEKRRQKSPGIMVAMGYFLVGVTATISASLFGVAVAQAAGLPQLF